MNSGTLKVWRSYLKMGGVKIEDAYLKPHGSLRLNIIQNSSLAFGSRFLVNNISCKYCPYLPESRREGPGSTVSCLRSKIKEAQGF